LHFQRACTPPPQLALDLQALRVAHKECLPCNRLDLLQLTRYVAAVTHIRPQRRRDADTIPEQVILTADGVLALPFLRHLTQHVTLERHVLVSLSTVLRKYCVNFMVMKPPVLPLTAEPIQHLTDLTSRGTVAVKTYRRAAALFARHQGQSYSAVGRHLGVRYTTVARWTKPFAERGLALLYDQPRSGRPLAITGPERAALTALAGSPAPDGHGHSQWSLRLLAGKAVELGLCHRLSASSAHPILKKTSCDPT
jgi:transposase